MQSCKACLQFGGTLVRQRMRAQIGRQVAVLLSCQPLKKSWHTRRIDVMPDQRSEALVVGLAFRIP